ncbi:hypothetical protein CA223_09425 [Sphingomonas koreensis]|jgi:hypothetical protein|uniref:Uncharacterized protein n=1 Tax=Sphingomonas koreensis TaxID=93064 RepID=A0A1L6JA86_9SPHN|nr:hypothetical protein [Sphingomonas koreensis]APR52757.1 hypothetical protein BRX40_10275 [Sphingomonas koreensis]MDC7811083.1 hypothetical protein [Sphingomonas koreensis]RSU19265.1 hypothetical protein CA224_13000 [Sphingomonas koreensis]RSU28413.1 hypothetical protein CA222_04950 [Sphingomonas koreensis]RSU31267.1 hypothetical protein CA225_04035 [Sphingomonas koreensis]
MINHSIRFFADDSAIAHLGEGLIACTLAREEWTHEAHLAACLYLLDRRRDIDVDGEIAGLISRFNESVGGVNDDQNGYHDTITRTYVAGVRRFLREEATGDLTADVNALLASETGSRNWPLRFYSRERLFSVEARRGFVQPDRAPLP